MDKLYRAGRDESDFSDGPEGMNLEFQMGRN